MSKKVIKIRGREFAIECRAGQMRYQLAHYEQASNEQLDMYEQEYKDGYENREGRGSPTVLATL